MEELVALGRVGLCEAAVRYQPALHPSFAAYAARRIYGSMIDAFRGANYPRQTQELPECWLDGGTDMGARGEVSHRKVPPPQLIDPEPSVKERLIRVEEEQRLTISITEARKRLTVIEGRWLDSHLARLSMREIGARHRRSGAWAHYTIHRGRKKLRQHFDDEQKAA